MTESRTRRLLILAEEVGSVRLGRETPDGFPWARSHHPASTGWAARGLRRHNFAASAGVTRAR